MWLSGDQKNGVKEDRARTACKLANLGFHSRPRGCTPRDEAGLDLQTPLCEILGLDLTVCLGAVRGWVSMYVTLVTTPTACLAFIHSFIHSLTHKYAWRAQVAGTVPALQLWSGQGSTTLPFLSGTQLTA